MPQHVGHQEFLYRKQKEKMKVNKKQIRARCRQSIKSIFKECKRKRNGSLHGTVGDQYAFIDNNSNVLMVAHADTVFGKYRKFKITEKKVYSPNLDDRLGVYLALDYFPRIGIHTDILITENEEKGSTTAKLFKTDKKYNWIVEVDRRGTGVVTYCYKSPEWLKALGEFLRIKWGTFSDISTMQDLGVSACNIGIGYHMEHTANCFCDIKELHKQIDGFVSFYNKYKNTAFPHEKVAYSSYGGGGINGYASKYQTHKWQKQKDASSPTQTSKTIYLPIKGAIAGTTSTIYPYYCPVCKCELKLRDTKWHDFGERICKYCDSTLIKNFLRDYSENYEAGKWENVDRTVS